MLKSMLHKKVEMNGQICRDGNYIPEGNWRFLPWLNKDGIFLVNLTSVFLHVGLKKKKCTLTKKQYIRLSLQVSLELIIQSWLKLYLPRMLKFECSGLNDFCQ